MARHPAKLSAADLAWLSGQIPSSSLEEDAHLDERAQRLVQQYLQIFKGDTDAYRIKSWLVSQDSLASGVKIPAIRAFVARERHGGEK